MKLSLFESKTKKQLQLTNEQVNKIQAQVREASEFINQIEKGNLENAISNTLLESELGASLLSMKKHLDRIAVEEQTRSWLNTGLATFSDILRNKNSLSLKDLSNDILINLIKYIDANQGAIFVLEGDEQSNQHLTMISCYAYNRKKHLDKRIELGEGLAGQCVLEKQSIYLKEIPKNYVHITSGLGEAPPRTVFIAPLIINESVFGVIELASLKEFKPQHLDFVNKLAENVAASIKTVKESERILSLLNASQQQSEELRSQEEEMRQNMEEMQATQEEMGRKSNELARASAEMEGVISGINATMATIEFQPDGTVMSANDNFLKAMQYTHEKIKGSHHRIFVPKEVLESQEYNTFWTRLAAGNSIAGTFKRISATGDTVWLNAIYNPIFSATGEVVKVVKFATDITEQQEMLAESKGILEGINATMATIEFLPDGTVINANENFLKAMKYSLNNIKGKHHRIFAPKDVIESEEYKTFWTSLASGESKSGVFERVASSGETVWLSAIYNPIRNATGDVVKVVKFATDLTKEKAKEAEVHQLLEETRAQEEELRQNMEEMQATQDEMQRKSNELTNASAEMVSIMHGINATMATIEFKPDGTILTANDNFLKSMKYSVGEITGKHHSMFVPKSVLESDDYKTFWKRLATGEPIAGNFNRVSSKNDTVLLSAIYNPIVDGKGKVVKVIKFATDITEYQKAKNG